MSDPSEKTGKEEMSDKAEPSKLVQKLDLMDARMERLESVMLENSNRVTNSIAQLIQAISGSSSVISAVKKEPDKHIAQARVEPDHEMESENEQPTGASVKMESVSQGPYEAILNPFQRSIDDLNEYVQKVILYYKSGERINVPADQVAGKFYVDFMFWEEENFKVLDREIITSLRNFLVDKGLNIVVRQGHAIYLALSNFLKQHKRNILTREFEGGGYQPQSESNGHEAVAPTEVMNAAHFASPRLGQTIRPTGRPADVSKHFAKELRYSGAPKEPLRRRYKLFLDACKLCNLNVEDYSLMLMVMQSVFLKDSALIFFMDHLVGKVASTNDAVDRLEEHFLSPRARRVNDEVWEELSFNFVMQERTVKKLSATYEDCLEDLLNKVLTLSELRTSPGTDNTVMSKLLSAVRSEGIFATTVENPPNELQQLKCVLRSRAMEADRKAVRSSGSSRSANVDATGYYVDRNLKQRDNRNRMKGYGAGSRDKSKSWKGHQRNGSKGATLHRVPKDICIICFTKGCHSSRCAQKTRAYLAILNEASSSSESESEVEPEDNIGDEDDVAVGFHVTTSRALACMGMKSTEETITLQGGIIDTGSSILSTIGDALIICAKSISAKPTEVSHTDRPYKLEGISISVETLGTMIFYFIFGGKMYSIKLHIVPGSSPLLLCHKDLDEFGLNYQTLNKTITRISDGYEEKALMIGGVPYLMFKFPSYLSAAQLRNIHRNLGHPSVEKQMKLMEQALGDDLPDGTRSALQKLADHCHACQLTKAKPRRFLFSMRDAITGEFNHILEVDVMKLPDGNVLHVLCTGTGFQQGQFIAAMSAREAWRVLRSCWINIYAGAPDIIRHDAGTNFQSQEFGDYADKMGIQLKCVPTEAHERIGSLERRHSVVRRVYKKLTLDMPDISKEDRLSLTFRAINDVPDRITGISPTTLVFGVYPKLPGSKIKSLTLSERVQIIRDSSKLAEKLRAKETVRLASKQKRAPDKSEIEAVRALKPGSTVKIFKEKGGWKLYKLVAVNGNEVIYKQDGGGNGRISIHSVRKYNRPPWSSTCYDSNQLRKDMKDNSDYEDDEYIFKATVTEQNSKKTSKSSAKSNRKTVDVSQFKESRFKEMKNLFENGTFEIVPEKEVGRNRFYSSVFVDKVKKDGTRKSRFCVAAFNDKSHSLFTAAPTIRRMSLRLIFCLAAMFKFSVFVRDVTQAFIHSETKLQRPVYVRPPKYMGLKGMALKVIRPLYGLPESPMHWFFTYLSHHRGSLGMYQWPLDPCLLLRSNAKGIEGLIGLQVDDTILCGTSKFLELEECKSAHFPSTGRKEISHSGETYNGVNVTQSGESIIASQQQYVETIPRLGNSKTVTFEEFRSIKAKYAYLAYSTVPSILCYIAKLSQVTETLFEKEGYRHVNVLKKVEKICKSEISPIPVLTYVPLPSDSAEVFVCIDAAFATNADSTSQLGVLAMVRDPSTKRCNVIHFVSMKSRRVARSVLSAELFAMVEGFDIGFSIRDILSRATGNSATNLTLATDSRSLYSLTITLGKTTERRLMIDLSLIREAYEKREITNLVWISGRSNPADDLTKHQKQNGELVKLVMSNCYAPDAEAWIDRKDSPVRIEANLSNAVEQKESTGSVVHSTSIQEQ